MRRHGVAALTIVFYFALLYQFLLSQRSSPLRR